MKQLVLIGVLMITVVACKKAEDRRCFKSVGESATKEVIVEAFDKLFLGAHIKFELIQDTEEKVVLKGGKNLLNFITTDIVDGVLRIENKNKCNFLRSFSKIVTAEIHLKDIVNIEFEGTEELLCINQLNVGDLAITIRDGAGKFNMNLDANSLHFVITHGWGNYELVGQVNYLNMEVRSNGFGTSYGLSVSDSVLVKSSSTENLMINADGCLLRTQTFEAGDIWYKGIPSLIEHHSYGDGQLVNKN